MNSVQSRQTTPWRAMGVMALAVAQVFGARILGQAAGVLTAVIAARYMGPESFGLYSFALTAALLLAQVPGSGLDMSAVRLSAGYWSDQPARARGVLAAAGLTKLTVGLLLLLGVTAATMLPAWRSIGRPELVLPLRLAALAALAIATTEFSVATLQSRERFGLIAIASVGIALIRLLPIAALAGAGALHLHSGLIAFVGAAWVSAIASLLFAWGSWSGGRDWSAGTLRALFGYTGWLVAGTLLGAATSSLDVLVLAQLAEPATVGIYASGRTLALPLAMVCTAVSAVLLPRLSRMAREAIEPYTRIVALQLAAAGFVVAAGVLLGARSAVGLVYGAAYMPAAEVFTALAFAYLAQLVTWPAAAVLLALNRPDIVALLSVAMLAITAFGYAAAAPAGGAAGVAWVYCATSTLMIVPYWLIARRLLRSAAAQQPAATLAATVES